MKTYGHTICCFLVISLISSVLILQDAYAGTWYVDGSRTIVGSGISWDSAFNSIQDAISNEEVQDGDEIWVKAGRYNLTESIVVNKSIHIYGGFSGDETMRNQRDWVNNESIIDGQSIVDHCISILNADAKIDGFTISGGYSDGGGTAYFGGGLIALDSAPIISNCIFEDNYAQMGGAGLDTWNSSPIIISCIFRRNVSVAGGAIRFRDSFVTITDSIFEDNISSGDNPKGAGVYAWNTTITVRHTEFLNNISNGIGGGFSAINGDVTLEDCVFSGNRAVNGGAISNDGAELTISNCKLFLKGGRAPPVEILAAIVRQYLFGYTVFTDGPTIHFQYMCCRLAPEQAETDNIAGIIIDKTDQVGVFAGQPDGADIRLPQLVRL